jgi:hypothetical protein
MRRKTMNTLQKAHKVLINYATHCQETGQPIPLKAVNTIRALESLRYTPQEGQRSTGESKPAGTSLDGCPIPQAKGRSSNLRPLRRSSNLQPLAREAKIMKDLERFKSKIKFNPVSGCDEWTGRIDKIGYAIFDVGGRTVRAGRWLWKTVVGEIPQGFDLSHACHCKKCVRITLPGVGGSNRIKTDRKSRYKTTHCICESHKDNCTRSAREKVWSGSRNGNAKLTDAEVKRMRKLYQGGGAESSPKQLAKDFGVSERTVYGVITYETYEDIVLKPVTMRRRERISQTA